MAFPVDAVVVVEELLSLAAVPFVDELSSLSSPLLFLSSTCPFSLVDGIASAVVNMTGLAASGATASTVRTKDTGVVTRGAAIFLSALAGDANSEATASIKMGKVIRGSFRRRFRLEICSVWDAAASILDDLCETLGMMGQFGAEMAMETEQKRHRVIHPTSGEDCVTIDSRV